MFSPWMTTSSTTHTSQQPSQSGAPPPDVILEVGPPPFTRYAAHSVLLSAHSGYLRSAMRAAPSQNDETINNAPIYLHNITADQIGPLLGYMYTGFLDLTVDNIFAVLLASHVLHMPRAAEICRTFLARSQSEDYLGRAGATGLIGDNSRIVRPIASKASIVSGISFVAPPTSNGLMMPSQDTPFRILTSAIDEEKHPNAKSVVTEETIIIDPEPVEVIVNSVVKNRPLPTNKNIKKPQNSKETAVCDVVTDPVKFDPDSGKTTIIDIASCDGPVRFRRVLNEAYGRISTTVSSINIRTPVERSQQNLTTSFHLQMAKTISENTRNNAQSSNHSDESENSQDIKVSSEAVNPEPPTLLLPMTPRSMVVKPPDEVYSCVYCKHTFKSQYCYQKHAKRHINPLTIDDTERIVETIDSDSDDRSSSGGGGGGGAAGGGNERVGCRRLKIVRREVRPLDMNVQYYPCKTCGSKFPSYYFVHKHRKLCHSTEEN